jgi:hypothetical protein
VVKKTSKKTKGAASKAKKKAEAAGSTGGAMGGMEMNATPPSGGADVKGGVDAGTPKQ